MSKNNTPEKPVIQTWDDAWRETDELVRMFHRSRRNAVQPADQTSDQLTPSRPGREPGNKLPAARRRSHVIAVRVTEAEYQRLADAADARQLTISSYLAAIAAGRSTEAKLERSAINELRRQGALLKRALTDVHDDDSNWLELRLALHAVQSAINDLTTGERA